MSNRRWVAQSPDRVGAVLEKFSRLYGADAVQFHDMDFFISEAAHAGDCGSIEAARHDVVGARTRRRADALHGRDVGRR